jgi:putative endonuclease
VGPYWVYILANKHNNVVYVGMTNDLQRRVLEHKTGNYSTAFTRRYNITKLVWYEQRIDLQDTLLHEKRLKRWRRPWKDALIAKMNPEWKDLSEGWYDPRDLSP